MLFLTGLPRTGTTWACRALHAALGGSLCFEPANFKGHPEAEPWHMRYLPAPLPGEPARLPRGPAPATDTPAPATSDGDAAGDAARFDRFVDRALAAEGDHGSVTVTKDVHTCLAVERWALRSDTVVIMARHPLAVAASWQQLGYGVDFRIERLLDQPDLLADHLEPFAPHLRQARTWHEQVGAYWGASYLVLARQTDRHPHWRTTTHEALLADPHGGFAALLESHPADLGALTAFLEATDRPRNPDEGPYQPVRERAREADKWRDTLDDQQVAEVLAGAAPFGSLQRWYPDAATLRPDPTGR